VGHPSQDWKRFEQAKFSLDQLFEKPFRGSPLWPNAESRSWFFGDLADASGDPDSWAELSKPKPLGPNKTVKAVLLHIRHALAHGNIFTGGNQHIAQIILLSARAAGASNFNFLAVAPADFRHFLKNWLEFLRELRLPDDVVAQVAGADTRVPDSDPRSPSVIRPQRQSTL
jgi:hypothetical protein